MIVCPRCGKENQDHYKFCLGCGAELPRDAAQPKSFTAPTPPAGLPVEEGGFAPPGGFSPSAVPGPAPRAATQPPPAAPSAPIPAPQGASAEQPAPTFGGAAAAEPLDCLQCGASVPPNFKFCGSCGFDMSAARAAATEASPASIAPPVAAPAPSPTPGGSGGRLVLIRPDGTEGETFPFQGTTTVGRETPGPFGADSYLSPKHAEFRFEGGRLVVRDLSSLNGVYVRIEREVPTPLADGAVFRIGQEILRFEAYGPPTAAADGAEPMGSPNPGYVGRLRLVTGRETHGNAHPIGPDGMRLGRERGDVIFPEDGYVSGLHCELKRAEDGTMYLTDVGSSNGTFVRVVGEMTLDHGTLLLMGQQLFRAEAG
ncbi:MAG: FHA domain-containing protein [Myxococcota bacterium]